MTQRFVRETVIRVTGTFDGDAASQLRGMLASAWASEPGTVVLDFSLAREVSDVGLAALIEPLVDGRVQLRFRGLTQRQRSMLRLLAPPAVVVAQERRDTSGV